MLPSVGVCVTLHVAFRQHVAWLGAPVSREGRIVLQTARQNSGLAGSFSGERTPSLRHLQPPLLAAHRRCPPALLLRLDPEDCQQFGAARAAEERREAKRRRLPPDGLPGE